jgi:hypothetical protein
MIVPRFQALLAHGLLAQAVLAAGIVSAQEWKSGVEWREPPVVAPGENGQPPSDAIVLFNGTDLSQWEGGERWLVRDGAAVARGGDIRTRQSFGDIQLHIEWAAPAEVEGQGQGRGNSGVFLMGLYEVQILDSYNNATYFDGQAASIYKQTPPMANAMRPPGQWNSYDIIFSAPEFRVNGALRKPAYVTVIHNGVLVLNHFEILGSTGFTAAPSYAAHAERGPIALQFHGNPVQFRNIWVRELHPPVGHRAGAPYNVERKPQRRKRIEETTGPGAAPESKPDSKPESKPDSKPEAKADSKPQAPPDLKPEAKADTRPEARKEFKPEEVVLDDLADRSAQELAERLW